MFTTFFKMQSQPFTENVSIEQIYRDDRMTQGLARLQYMASQTTIALIQGQTGVGKSVLIKLLLSSLPENYYKPIYIFFTNIKSSSLLKLIVNGLGEQPALTKEKTFLQIMDKVTKSKLKTIIIVDEAHLLDKDALTDLRLLVSSGLQDSPQLKIILSGQEEIKEKLKRNVHKDFSDRISIHFHLKPLSKAQTVAYIDFQLKYAGVSEKIFDSEVKEMIYEYSNGIPRKINNIATGCLINAAIQKEQRINMELFNQVIPEIQLF